MTGTFFSWVARKSKLSKNRSCGLLLWAALIFTLLVVSPKKASATPEDLPDYSLISDTRGFISSAVISVNSARRAALRNTALVTQIVNSLPESVKISILTNDPAAFTVARNPWQDRIKFIHLPADNSITIWTQDPFLVLKGKDQTTSLLASKEFQRAGDSLMVHKIAEHTGWEVKKSSLYFEGGNIVSDENFTFIGANTIRLNAIKLEISEVQAVKRFESELGRKVLVVGPFPQIVAHIDMILTPLGNGQLTLADPTQGAVYAQEALNSDSAAVEAFEQFCEQYFFGNPAILEVPGANGKTLTHPALKGKTSKMIELSQNIGPELDKIAAGLEQYGYQVHRIPFLFGGPESIEGSVIEADVQASYPMLTYNNVLIESSPDIKKVYLPVYGWQAMDTQAQRAWEKIGFTVHQVKGLAISSMYGGSLRCSVKVLERKPTCDFGQK